MKKQYTEWTLVNSLIVTEFFCTQFYRTTPIQESFQNLKILTIFAVWSMIYSNKLKFFYDFWNWLNILISFWSVSANDWTIRLWGNTVRSLVCLWNGCSHLCCHHICTIDLTPLGTPFLIPVELPATVWKILKISCEKSQGLHRSLNMLEKYVWKSSLHASRMHVKSEFQSKYISAYDKYSRKARLNRQ